MRLEETRVLRHEIVASETVSYARRDLVISRRDDTAAGSRSRSSEDRIGLCRGERSEVGGRRRRRESNERAGKVKRKIHSSRIRIRAIELPSRTRGNLNPLSVCPPVGSNGLVFLGQGGEGGKRLRSAMNPFPVGVSLQERRDLHT